MRRLGRRGWSARLRRKRAKLGKEITQWRKSQGQTVATASAAPSIIADLQRQVTALSERVEELEDTNQLLEEELESYREHEEALEGGEESSDSFFDFGAEADEPEEEPALADDPNGDVVRAAVETWLDPGVPQSPLSDMLIDT